MNRNILFMAAALLGLCVSASVEAGYPMHPAHRRNADRGAYWYNNNMSWHGPYANVQWGHPVALIVPPTGPLTCDQVVVSAPGETGRPSSLTVATRLRDADRSGSEKDDVAGLVIATCGARFRAMVKVWADALNPSLARSVTS